MRAEARIEPSGVSEVVVFVWGTAGVSTLLGQAIYRLTPQALHPLVHGNLTSFQVALYIGWVLFAAYTEGYRAFQGRFSPRVVARAVYLAKNREPWLKDRIRERFHSYVIGILENLECRHSKHVCPALER